MLGGKILRKMSLVVTFDAIMSLVVKFDAIINLVVKFGAVMCLVVKFHAKMSLVVVKKSSSSSLPSLQSAFVSHRTYIISLIGI